MADHFNRSRSNGYPHYGYPPKPEYHGLAYLYLSKVSLMTTALVIVDMFSPFGKVIHVIVYPDTREAHVGYNTLTSASRALTLRTAMWIRLSKTQY